MKIHLFDQYTLQPFDLQKHYPAYIKLLENNHGWLHTVEMDHIAYYYHNQLLSWFEKVKTEQSPNYLIYEGETIIGRITLYNTDYDGKTFAALSILLDKKYHNLGIMSTALQHFFKHCETLGINNILWEAKAINAESNHLAIKLGFHLWKAIQIDPKLKNPNWTCTIYNLYLR